MLNKEIKTSTRLRIFQLVGVYVPYVVESLKRFSSNGTKLISQFVKINSFFILFLISIFSHYGRLVTRNRRKQIIHKYL